MALPLLSTPKASSKVLDSIKQTLSGKSAANDSEITRESSPSPEIEKTSKSKIVDLDKFRQKKQEQSNISKNRTSNVDSNSRQRASNLNEKAIEKSQSQVNPLIPLISHINGTLSSIYGTLKSILFAIKNQTDELKKSLARNELGDSGGDFDFDFGKRKPKEKSRRDRARDRQRERNQRRRTSSKPKGRFRQKIKSKASGVLGLASLFGLDQLLPDDAQDAIDTGSTALDTVDTIKDAKEAMGFERTAEAGVRGAGAGAESGGILGRFGKVLGSGSKIFSKFAVPLTVGMSLYENSDELLDTGAIDPLKQAGIANKGLMDIINPQDTEDDQGGLHLMKRLGGVGDVLSGTVGTVLGGITTGGKTVYNALTGQDTSNPVSDAVNKVVPSDISDSIVDGIIGLFGGETATEKEKKFKEKLDKEMAEKKKIRQEEEKKEAEEKSKKDAEKGIKPPNIPPVSVDSSGNPVPIVNTLQSKETQESINRSTTEESLKPNLPTSVSILQPDGKPIPVVLTDDKGKPLISSLDQAAASSPGVPGASPVTSPPGVPGASPVTSPPGVPGASPVTSPPGAAKSKEASELFGIPSDIIPKAGQGMAWLVNQQNAIPEKYRNNPNPVVGNKPSNTSAAIVSAQSQAQIQDSNIPPPPTPQNTVSQTPSGQKSQTGITSGPRTVAGSYTSTPEDSKYFKGDLSKLNGMDPVFVEKLKAASSEAGVALPLTSGFRSQEKQNQLRAEAVKKYGSEEAASKWVAKTSIHTTGNAADFSMGGDAKKFWDSNPKLVEAMEKQGLHRPLSHEAWHWESDVTKGQDRKGLANKLINQRNEALATGTQPQTGQTQTTPSLAQTAQGAATGVAGMLASQGVPGAAAVTGAIAGAPKSGTKNSLMSMIAAGESKGGRAGYDVSYANVKSDKPLTEMTLSEVQQWQKQLPGLSKQAGAKTASSAVGKWQMMPATIAEGMKNLKLDPNTKFTPEIQDKIIENRLRSTRKLGDFESGKIDSKTMQRNLAKEFASIPDPDTGKSYYNTKGQPYAKAGGTPQPVAHSNEEVQAALAKHKANPNDPSSMAELTKSPAAAPTAPQITQDANKEAQAASQLSSQTPQSEQNNDVSTDTSPNQTEQLTPVSEQPSQIEPESFTDQAISKVKEASKMLGIPEDAIPKAGQGMAWLVNQQNAIPEKYRNNPNPVVGNQNTRQQQLTSTTRENSSSQPAMNELYAKQTFTGSVPPPAKIPDTVTVPPEMSSAPARIQQNFRLLNHPRVQATIDTLKAGGSNILNTLGNTVSNFGIDKIPGDISSGINAVDQIRTNGALKPMLDGNISDVISKVSPNLSSFPGLQSIYDQSMSGLGNYSQQFKSLTNDVLNNNTVTTALDTGKKTLGTLGNKANELMGNFLSPAPQNTSNPLEAASIGDRQNDVAASHSTPQVSGGSGGASQVAPERGSSLMSGDQAPLEVRNSESSIRRLTDMLIAFSFG